MTYPRPQLIAAAPISFTSEDAIDSSSTRRILESIRETVGHALVLGTTAEFPALRTSERRWVAEQALDILGADRAVIHIGIAGVHRIREELDYVLRRGARRIALLTPFYLPVDQDSIVAYYEEVAQDLDSQHELFAYVFPQRAGVDMTPETVARVAAIPRVGGIKVSGKSLIEISAYQKAAPSSFQIFTGADADVVEAQRRGLAGVVSGVSAALPRPFQLLQAATLRGDAVEAAAIERVTQAVVRTVDGRIAALKRILQLRGIGEGRMRMAADPLDAHTEAALAQFVEEWA